MKILLFLCIFISFLSLKCFALVGVGGYVPFGKNTQQKPDGGTNTTTFHPQVGIHGHFPVVYGHFALPEVGLVIHRDMYDGVKKQTYYVLWDVGYPIFDSWLLRYGIGTFMTRISSEGGYATLKNGNQDYQFPRPDHSETSYNTTWNAGIEYSLDRNYTLRAETFIFGIWRSRSRKVSYALNFNYYL